MLQAGGRGQQARPLPAVRTRRLLLPLPGSRCRPRAAVPTLPWRRPLLPCPADEKLAVFLEGQDDALLHYDGGEFYQWLRDCEAGARQAPARLGCRLCPRAARAGRPKPAHACRPAAVPILLGGLLSGLAAALACAAGDADPADGAPYPLVVQDKELRTLLEIKPPDQEAPGDLRLAAAAKAQAVAGEGAAAIIVPTVRLLPLGQQPDQLVREHNPPVVQRLVGESPELVPDVPGTSAAALAASAAWRSAELAVARDPPYIRYVQVGGAGARSMRAAGQQACRHPGSRRSSQRSTRSPPARIAGSAAAPPACAFRGSATAAAACAVAARLVLPLPACILPASQNRHAVVHHFQPTQPTPTQSPAAAHPGRPGPGCRVRPG